MLKVLIVDDEPILVQDIKTRLERHYSQEIVVVGEAGRIKEAKILLETLNPDILLLDVHLTDGTGFDLIEMSSYTNFALIFITGYDNNAIKAIKVGALDYILKPIDDNEFNNAVEKAISFRKHQNNFKGVVSVANNYYKGIELKKIVFKTSDSIYTLNQEDILYCHSEGNYTTVHTISEEILVTMHMKKMQELLPDDVFIRCHQSYIVNKAHVRKFNKRGYVVIDNGIEIPVSVRRREATILSISQ